ncbi:MAG: hypothetical protein QOF11_2535, partial [Chloroflexota bacterium]|nr:hypothetical protein [Chloroflexota bacterium]
MPTVLIERPTDATLSVTKAARLLGVHPNTIRAWSDQGRLRYYRINPRGDRRYRLGDLERFLDDAEGTPIGPLRVVDGGGPVPGRRRGGRARVTAGGQRGQSRPHLEVLSSAATENVDRMISRAAQLQSIHQLGGRLSRLTSGREIGMAIATELRDIIDYHNVRVYRVIGTDLVPVAFSGQVGEYVAETPEQLRIAVGMGITGWVAANGVAQNLPDAARDPRAETIPGTEDDLEESMLLAPMTFDDAVLGVLVLSKLGLDQFSEDDLRLLEIYASLAAQAFANADSTELLRERTAALERQLRNQSELLQITESILTTLDPGAVLEQITDRLGNLVGY